MLKFHLLSSTKNKRYVMCVVCLFVTLCSFLTFEFDVIQSVNFPKVGSRRFASRKIEIGRSSILISTYILAYDVLSTEDRDLNTIST